ncbi:hypothetical protein SAMN05216316_3177 [Nitrosovibrio sp. Nv6]|nr:hypothetical protein SAMN05216316_3177 [Nitrosovibrio sp. Nv6]
MKKITSSFTTCATLLSLSVAMTPVANATSTTLPGIVRDFSPGPLVPGSTNPDFQISIVGVKSDSSVQHFQAVHLQRFRSALQGISRRLLHLLNGTVLLPPAFLMTSL